jgi:hypothetical protein
MPHSKADRIVWVTVDGRKFRVDFDEAGDAIRIIERKFKHGDKPWLCYFYNHPYWHRDHHTLGAMWTIPQRVLIEARCALEV